MKRRAFLLQAGVAPLLPALVPADGDERDTRATQHRAKIYALYTDRGIVPCLQGFGCRSLALCSAQGCCRLHTGNWAFVGSEYGQARIGGYLTRILFVAMDRGGYGDAANEQFVDTQASFRRHIEAPRNAHMGGVALILKHLVDERGQFQLSGQCAITNALKCVHPTNRMRTNPSKAMILHCADHLRAEIEALDPDVLVTQGRHPRDTVLGFFRGGHPRDTVRGFFPELGLVGEFFGEKRGRAAVLANSRLVVLTTPHPARQKGLKWKKGSLPQFFLEGIATARAEAARQSEIRTGNTNDTL